MLLFLFGLTCGGWMNRIGIVRWFKGKRATEKPKMPNGNAIVFESFSGRTAAIVPAVQKLRKGGNGKKGSSAASSKKKKGDVGVDEDGNGETTAKRGVQVKEGEEEKEIQVDEKPSKRGSRVKKEDLVEDEEKSAKRVSKVKKEDMREDIEKPAKRGSRVTKEVQQEDETREDHGAGKDKKSSRNDSKVKKEGKENGKTAVKRNSKMEEQVSETVEDKAKVPKVRPVFST
jgi:hypothetical protein